MYRERERRRDCSKLIYHYLPLIIPTGFTIKPYKNLKKLVGL
jgi:hypothetical protein